MISTLCVLALSATPVALQRPETVKASSSGAEITAALEAAARKNQRVLLVWGDAKGAGSQQLDALFQSDKEVARTLQYEYRVVRVKPEPAEEYEALAKKYGAVLEPDAAHLTVLSAEGMALANQSASTLMERDKPDAKKVKAFLDQHKAPQQQAKEQLDAALGKAGAQQKRVFLAFEKPPCEACHALDARLGKSEIQPLLDKEFVVCWIDVERSAGGKEMLAKLRGGTDDGTPWYVVLQPDGSPVVDSDDVTGKNLGFPKTPEEIDAWTTFLKRAKQHLTDEEVGQVVAVFKKAGATTPPKG